MKTFRVLKKKNDAQLERSLPASVELAILPKYINEIHPAAVIVAGYGKSDGRMSGFEGVGVLRGTSCMEKTVLRYHELQKQFNK